MKYNALNVEDKWKKKHRSLNAHLIPERLAELARSGVYYDSRVL